MDVRDKQSLPLSANQHVDFVAIDFETATSDPNSACAVGLAFVVGLRVVATTHHLIQPPGNRYDQGNIHVHGIYPEDTEHAPDFLTVWQELHPLLAGKALTAQKRRQRLIDRAVILHQQNPFHIHASHPVILPLIIPQRHKICKASQPFDIIRFLSDSFIFRSICAQKID